MPATSLRRMRRRLARYLIPAVIGLYLVMIPLNSVLESEHAEVFPFYKWRLFASAPDWETRDYGLAVEAIDGRPAPETLYLIPSDDVRDWKALRLAVTACTKGDDCDGTVAQVLVPLIHDALGEHSIDFRIVEAKVDLRDVGERIDDVVTGTMTRSDFFRPTKIIGRWNTETGRLDAATAASPSN